MTHTILGIPGKKQTKLPPCIFSSAHIREPAVVYNDLPLDSLILKSNKECINVRTNSQHKCTKTNIVITPVIEYDPYVMIKHCNPIFCFSYPFFPCKIFNFNLTEKHTQVFILYDF